MTEQLLRVVAPDQTDSPEQRAAKLEARDLRARFRRKLWFGPETDGSIEFGGSLPVVAGRRLQTMVQAVADRRYRSAKDTRNRLALQETPQQRAADALVDILGAAEAVEKGEAKTTSIPVGAAQIHVLIPYQDLFDRTAAAGLLIDGTPLSAGELRILACSADLIPNALGTDSQILDFGDTIRLAPPPLRRAIGLRDGGCAFPGCTTTMRHCELHHVKPWQEGGPTDRDNIVALCKVHHTLCEPRPPTTGPDRPPATQDGWDVRIDRGLPEFLPPAALDPARTPDAWDTPPPCSTTTGTHEQGDAPRRLAGQEVGRVKQLGRADLSPTASASAARAGPRRERRRAAACVQVVCAAKRPPSAAPRSLGGTPAVRRPQPRQRAHHLEPCRRPVHEYPDPRDAASVANHGDQPPVGHISTKPHGQRGTENADGPLVTQRRRPAPRCGAGLRSYYVVQCAQ